MSTIERSAPITDTASRVEPMNVVGRRLAHHDFVDKVKGSMLYAADWQLPGMLHSRIVRAVEAPARIVAVDVTAARELPGVVVVMTHEDVPCNEVIERASGGLGELLVPMPILATDRVRYVGEPVALIAAESQQIADEAAELVVVELEALPGVFDPEEALAPGAPQVHEQGNLLVEWNIRRGDVDAALASAATIVEGEYRTQHVEHAYLEPEAGVGWIEHGVVTLRVSTQVIEHAAEIAHILRLPASKVRVIASYMGGGFGGKEDMTVEPYLALLVWRAHRPVKMIWDRQESMIASTKRHPFVMRYRTGVASDGRIVAQQIDLVGDAGAYPCLSARIMFAGAALACGPYLTPAASVRSRAVFTNNVPTSAFRGFGAMQVTFAYESQMDKIAEVLALDRIEVRRRNFLAKGDAIPTGEKLETAVAVEETLEQALGLLGEPSVPSGSTKRVGRGVGCNMQPYGRTIWFRDRASAWLSLQADGTLLVRAGVTDLGAGQAASLCAIAAEVLGVLIDDVSVYIGDTALTPPAGGTYATRQLYMSGNAVLQAATLLRDKLAPVAVEALDCDAASLRFEGGAVTGTRASGVGHASLTLAELASACALRDVDPTVLAEWRASSGTFDPVSGQGASFPDYTFGTHAAEVEVDLETGEVRVLKYVACHDVGRAINPMRVEGQIQGGAVQGLGYALTEEVLYERGDIASSLFSSYFIPTSNDLPDVEVVVLESGEGKGPFGARGIGEPPIGNPAPTIANAIADAIGLRPTRLPMTPERVLALVESRASAEPRASTESRASTEPRALPIAE